MGTIAKLRDAVKSAGVPQIINLVLIAMNLVLEPQAGQNASSGSIWLFSAALHHAWARGSS